MRRRSAHGKEVARLAVCASDEALRGRIEFSLVEGGHEVIASTDSVQALTDVWGAVNARLIVLACPLEPFSPLQEIAALRSRVIEAPIVVVATGFLTTAARRIVRADVQGLLHETDLESALVATVDSVLADQLCVPATLRGALAEPVFSHREKQVLELVLAGLTNGEIASRLYLSESTVKSHLASTFRKLGVSSRVEAAQRLLGSDSDTDAAHSWISHSPTIAATGEPR